MENGRPRVRAVAFDCDGLMFNTEEAFFVAGHELLLRRGLSLTPEIHQLMMGRRAEEAFERLIRACDLPETAEELEAEYQGIFRATLTAMLDVMPGLIEFLDVLKSRSIPMAVCTSSRRSHLFELLDQFQLRDFFKVTLTAEDVCHGKPNPEIYLTAAERLGVNPREMLVLEDSGNGTMAAAAAGAIAVSVPHQHSAGHDLSAAYMIVESLADLRLLDLVGPLTEA